MTAPVDILYVIPRSEIGGAEHQLLMLLEGLDRRRFRPHVVCLDGAGSLHAAFQAACETVGVIGRRHALDLRALTRLVRTVRRIRPGIVHTWLHIANVYGGWAARLAGAPQVIASHRGLAKDPLHGLLDESLKRLLNLFVAQFADHLVTNAHAVARRMRQQGFRPDATTVVYNGLRDLCPSEAERATVAASLGLHDDQVLLGSIARIDPKKNLETMLRAVALVAREEPRARLLVVGGGCPDYLRSLEGLSRDLGIVDHVDFLGFRPDPHVVMSLCDISLLSSVTEGLPNGVLESMMLGKPVVATEVGGVPELVTDGVEGFLVSPGDHAALASRVLTLIRDPEIAQRMGRRGQRKAHDRFAAQAMLAHTQAIYTGLLAQSSVAGPPDAQTTSPVPQPGREVTTRTTARGPIALTQQTPQPQAVLSA